MFINKNVKSIFIFSIVFIYSCIVFWLVFFIDNELFSRSKQTSYGLLNLTPFETIKSLINARQKYIDNGQYLQWAANIYGNTFIFLPYAFLFTFTGHVLNISQALLLGAFLSLTVECTQGLFRLGAFDIDDLLLNTIGSIFGYLLAKIYIIRFG